MVILIFNNTVFSNTVLIHTFNGTQHSRVDFQAFKVIQWYNVQGRFFIINSISFISGYYFFLIFLVGTDLGTESVRLTRFEAA